jgi:hypothetical protein
MTAGNWVAIAALFVTVVVTLLVSYQQRKQMRQIEAFRVDPAVGLEAAATSVCTVFEKLRRQHLGFDVRVAVSLA